MDDALERCIHQFQVSAEQISADYAAQNAETLRKIYIRRAEGEELRQLIDKYVMNSTFLDAAGKLQPPTSLKAAKSRSDWPLWEYALKKETDAFKKLEATYGSKLVLTEAA